MGEYAISLAEDHAEATVPSMAAEAALANVVFNLPFSDRPESLPESQAKRRPNANTTECLGYGGGSRRWRQLQERQKLSKTEAGSPAWIRTTIHGSKGRCPTIRRPGNAGGASAFHSLPCVNLGTLSPAAVSNET